MSHPPCPWTLLPIPLSVGLIGSRSVPSKLQLYTQFKSVALHLQWPPLSPPECLPELLWGNPNGFFHGLPKILPHPSCYFSYHLNSFHQLAPKYHRQTKPDRTPSSAWHCPPSGSEITSTTGTSHVVATAPCSFLCNGGAEHGPLGLSVSRLPWNSSKVLKVWVVQDLASAWRSQCTLTIRLGGGCWRDHIQLTTRWVESNAPLFT